MNDFSMKPGLRTRQLWMGIIALGVGVVAIVVTAGGGLLVLHGAISLINYANSGGPLVSVNDEFFAVGKQRFHYHELQSVTRDGKFINFAMERNGKTIKRQLRESVFDVDAPDAMIAAIESHRPNLGRVLRAA